MKLSSLGLLLCLGGTPNKPLGSASLGTGTGSPVRRETGALTLTPTLVSFSLSENFHRKHCKAHKMRTLLQLETFASFHCCESKHFRYLIFFFLFVLALHATWSARMRGTRVWGFYGFFSLLHSCFSPSPLSFLSLTPLTLPCLSHSGKTMGVARGKKNKTEKAPPQLRLCAVSKIKPKLIEKDGETLYFVRKAGGILLSPLLQTLDWLQGLGLFFF